MTEELVIFTGLACGACGALRAWLKRRAIAFREISIEDDPEGRRLVRRAAGGYLALPTVVVPGGRVLVEPTLAAVEAAVVE